MPHRLTNMTDDLRTFLASRLLGILNWFSGLVASGVSAAAALGLVNVILGLLSSAWVATQLYRFWRFEVRQLREREAREQQQG